MLAADTNVLVRAVTADDPEQSPRARRLLAENEVWVSRTVLLETAWVLRSARGYPPARVAAALRGLAGLPNVALENPESVAQCLSGNILSVGLGLWFGRV